MTLPLATLLAFALTSLLVELTPGPNMAYLALLAASRGQRAGLLAVAGVACGLLLVGLAAAIGAATIIATFPILYDVLRWGGVAFMLWLSWEAWRDAETATVAESEPDRAKHFWRGALTNLLNPKAAIFYLAVLPTFVVKTDPILRQTVTLTLVYVAIATGIHVVIVLVASRMSVLLGASARAVRIRQLLAASLGGVALWFAYATAR